MNNSNYGYPPSSGYTSPFASTPTSIRPHRPRFGYSGPALYPRPRSSASKPNPDSFSDSMTNNYGNSTYNSESGDSYSNFYKSDSSNYYSANENFYPDQPSGDASMLSMRADMNLPRESPLVHADNRNSASALYPKPDNRNSALYPNSTPNFLQSKLQYKSPLFGLHSDGGFQKPYSPAFSLSGRGAKQSFSARKFGKVKRGGMASKVGSWKCQICDIDFTSQIPYDMHLRGAKHARKIKAQQVSSIMQSQGVVGKGGDKIFFCAVCNVTGNSSVQFQTHLDGSKHKNKLNPKEYKDLQGVKEDNKTANPPTTNGKPNGSSTRPLPSDFGTPQPTKLMKFSCDVCSISVNSDVQLQQHLSSKKHQDKVEGKPVVKRKKKMEIREAISTSGSVSDGVAEVSDQTASGEATQKVVGVKTLSSSFVQGETLN